LPEVNERKTKTRSREQKKSGYKTEKKGSSIWIFSSKIMKENPTKKKKF
jgi:hypothetical protein